MSSQPDSIAGAQPSTNEHGTSDHCDSSALVVSPSKARGKKPQKFETYASSRNQNAVQSDADSQSQTDVMTAIKPLDIETILNELKSPEDYLTPEETAIVNEIISEQSMAYPVTRTFALNFYSRKTPPSTRHTWRCSDEVFTRISR